MVLCYVRPRKLIHSDSKMAGMEEEMGHIIYQNNCQLSYNFNIIFCVDEQSLMGYVLLKISQHNLY